MKQPFYLDKKCTRGWDYRIIVLGLIASLYRACYSKMLTVRMRMKEMRSGRRRMLFVATKL
jgi:hypothetical protein